MAAPATAQMTTAERLATEAFHADLLAEFHENAAVMWPARSAGDTETYDACVEKTRVLYREIKEVEHVLATGVLPF